MMLSNKILKRFVKDFKLPIQVVEEPYFSYYINLYDKKYNTKEKLELLKDILKQFNNEEEFFEEYYNIRDNMINTIKNTQAYIEFNDSDFSKFNVPNNNYSKADVFKLNNINKCFLSIDLTKANFQALKYYNEDIILNCDSYEELIQKFTTDKTYKYFKNSKYLRQVIFGNMNPKRQVKIERYMIQKILDSLLDVGVFNKEDIRMVSNDEIVLEIPYRIDLNTNNIVKMIKDELSFDIHVEVYRLKNINGSTKYFIKEFISKEEYELMCIPLVYHAQIFKRYNNLDIIDNDLVFFYENQVCKFIKPLDFESEECISECSGYEK